MKNVMKKGILGLALATAFLMGFNVPVSAKQTKKDSQTIIFNGHPVMKNTMESIPLHGERKNTDKFVRNKGLFPAKFDARTTGGVTAVDNQRYTGNCWAFASIAAMEGDLIKKGYANSSLNLSENHLAYFFYHQQNDPLGNTGGDYNTPLKDYWWNQGGNALLAALHLQTWAGAVKEPLDEDEKYQKMEEIYDEVNDPGEGLALPASDCFKSDYRVKNSYFYENDVNVLKQAVTDHGAVTCSVYMPQDYGEYYAYYNEDTYAQYCYDAEGSNHAVTIVGWDDNFSKDNFVTSPSNDGAWIIKNSWGTDWGDGGYFYVSYEDPVLELNQTFVAYDVEKASATEKYNYQYDGSSCGDAINTFTGYANTFTAKTSEAVREVGVNFWSFDADYTIQIYTGLGNSDDPTSGTLACTQKGIFNGCGYQKIKLDNPVVIPKGNRYSVVVSVDSNTVIGVDWSSDEYQWVGFTSSANAKQSYALSRAGQWFDCGLSYGANLRIKSYTDEVTLELEKITAEKEKVSYKAGEKLNLDDLKVTAYYKGGFKAAIKNYTTNASQISMDKAGEKQLIVTYKEGNVTKTAEVKLSVSQKAKVKLNAMKIPLQVGKSTKALKITSKTPSNDKVSKWTTSNKKIATVDKKGKITGKKKGTATITVIMKSGAKAKCKVTVQKGKVVTKKLKLSKSKYTLKKGKSLSLIVSRNPITATEKLTWSTSNKKVATVDKKGKVKAKKKGKATITVKSANGKKAKCTITVK